MTKDAIRQRIEELQNKKSMLNIRQNAFKVLLNAGYGALGNPYFHYFDLRLAKAITYSAQVTSRWMENYLQQKGLVSVYMDTDSVVFSSKIKSKKLGNISIGDYYEMVSGVINNRGKNNFIKTPLIDDNVLSFNTNTENPEYQKVNYIMKHKVKKRMFRITVGNKSVEVTEDHSCIVYRNNKYASVKPKEIKKTDKLIHI